MKKKGYLILLFVFLLIINIIGIKGNSITGEIITGDATQTVGMSIFVTAYFPLLTIISPENKIYLTNESLLLNYSVSNEQVIWYNIDNLVNITIISSIYFNTSQGNHILYLYANSSFGNITSRNVSFVVNSSRFIIQRDEYNGSNKGASTNFLQYTYEDLQNLSNIILENTQSGKILFNQPINLTNDKNPDDNLLDLDTYTNVSFNRIELNSIALPNFNKPATLWLYNLTFSNPQILKDGAVCPSSICTEENYSGGTLKFNVTEFSIYTSEETPVESPYTAPSGGGGGREAAKQDFVLDKEKINVKLKQGETKKEILTINNTGTSKIKINLQIQKLKDFIKISEENFELEAGKSKEIILDFIAREETIPDLYISKLIISSESIKKEILIAIEVESKKSLFDVKVEILNKYKKVMPGEEIIVGINLYNLGEIKKADALLEYVIKDEEGNIIISEKETLAVETRAGLVKTFKIPEDAKYGEYIFYIRVIYIGEVASASAWFSVGEVEKPFLNKENIVLVIIIIILLALIAMFIEFKILKKHTKRSMKTNKNILF